MKKLMVTGISLAVLCPALALAQGNGHQTGVYLGGSYGGYKARGGDFDDENDLYEVLGGWQITPHVGIEGNYTDFGKYGSSAASADVDGVGAALVGQLPLTDSFSLYGKGGLFWWDGDVRVLGAHRGFEDESLFYGVGARFRLTDAVGLTAEYKRYEIEFEGEDFPVPPDSDDTDLDTITVGARVSF